MDCNRKIKYRKTVIIKNSPSLASNTSFNYHMNVGFKPHIMIVKSLSFYNSSGVGSTDLFTVISHNLPTIYDKEIVTFQSQFNKEHNISYELVHPLNRSEIYGTYFFQIINNDITTPVIVGRLSITLEFIEYTD
jgi:hypothetical protein